MWKWLAGRDDSVLATNIVTECFIYSLLPTHGETPQKIQRRRQFLPTNHFPSLLNWNPRILTPFDSAWIPRKFQQTHPCCSISDFHSAMYTTWTSSWLHTTSANISFSQPTLIRWAKNINSNSALVLFCHNPISSRCPRNIIIIIIIIEHEHKPTCYSPANSSLAFVAWVFVVPLAARPRGISLLRSFQESLYLSNLHTKKQQKHIRSNLNSLLRILDLVDRQKKKKLASSEHHPPILIVGCQSNERRGSGNRVFRHGWRGHESTHVGPGRSSNSSKYHHLLTLSTFSFRLRKSGDTLSYLQKSPTRTTFRRHGEVVCLNHDHGL